MVFTDLSGHVGLRAFQLDADCLRSGRAEQGPPLPCMAWGGGLWLGGSRGGTVPRLNVLPATRCYNCLEIGHIWPDCPDMQV